MDGSKLLTGSDEGLVAVNFGTAVIEQQTLGQTGHGLVGGRWVYRAVKRMVDLVVSLLGLLVFAVVFAGTALAILAEDGGPVLYVQKRIGKDGRVFEIYKFRSMYKNAEAAHESLKEKFGCEEVSFKLQDDPRITRVGKIIRKFNIDELPQLINILKGDMSLVGPRPLPVYEYEEEQRKYGNTYIERYAVPQGLTCIWQISDRASVCFEERMRMDVEYAKKRGLFMDLKLIIKTFVFTVTGKAAY